MAAEESPPAMPPATTRCGNQKLPDDLISDIVLRSDLRSVYRFKCVSKDWNRNLSAPSFRLAFISLRKESVNDSPPPLLLGFFRFRRDPSNLILNGEEEGPPGFSFLPTDLEGEPLYSLEFLNKIKKGHFHCVSNGLVLCGDYPNLHVFNPITRQICSLPRANFNTENFELNNLKHWAASPGFISSQFDNDFRVIVPFYGPVIKYGSEKAIVNIYSSKTRLWTPSELIAVARFRICATVLSPSFDGTCFWLTTQGYILAYNPDKNDKRVQLIRLPRIGKPGQTLSLCLSRDGFLQCALDDSNLPGFRVYVLSETLSSYGYEDVVDPNKWATAYSVKLDEPNEDWSPYGDRRLCDSAICAGFHPMNPRILYFRMGTRIFSCDVEEGKPSPIPYGGRLYLGSEKVSVWPYVQLPWPPSPSAMP